MDVTPCLILGKDEIQKIIIPFYDDENQKYNGDRDDNDNKNDIDKYYNVEVINRHSIHSHLFKRAGKKNMHHGHSSLTVLPVIYTQAGNMYTYIPTDNICTLSLGVISYLQNFFIQRYYRFIC